MSTNDTSAILDATPLFEAVVKRFRRDLGGLRFGLLVPLVDEPGVGPRVLALIELLLGSAASVRVYVPPGPLHCSLQATLGETTDSRVITARSGIDAVHAVDGVLVPLGRPSVHDLDLRHLRGVMRQPIWFDGRDRGGFEPLEQIGFECHGPVVALEPPVELPSESLNESPSESPSDPLSNPLIPSYPTWKVVHGLPVLGLPHDFPIPPLVGEGNDYRFIEAAARQATSDRRGRVSIVMLCRGQIDRRARLIDQLRCQDYPRDRLELVVACPRGIEGPPRAPEGLAMHAVTAAAPIPALNAGLQRASGAQIVLMREDYEISPRFIATVVGLLETSRHALVFGSRHPQAIELIERTDALASARHPFAAVDGSCVAFGRRLVDELGPLHDHAPKLRSAFVEWAYRAYNAGGYLIPLPSSVGSNDSLIDDQSAAALQDTSFLAEWCPLGFRDDGRRRYRVPKVSIYMPAYNAGPYIQEAIESALAQDFVDLEVCVVDDGSTDDTRQILESTYAEHPQVRWKSQPHQGIAAASNAAIRMCKGAYLGLLDADDMLLPHAVRTLSTHLDEHAVGYVYGSNVKVDTQGRFLRPGYEWPVFSREKLLVSNIAHHFRMFRRRDWLRTSGHDVELENATDFDMALKLAEVCTLEHLANVMYLYRWHGDNTSIANRALQRRNHLRGMRRALQRMGLDDAWEVNPPLSSGGVDGVYRQREPAS
ncbi:MAG: glycosyltransferase [Myxococcota bacterium]